MTIMVDTGAWYALADTSDTYHQRAKAFYQQIAGNISMLITDAILVEIWFLLASRLGRTAALTFWDTLRKTDIKIICLTEFDLEAAWHTINTYTDQSFSFTDCTTFSIMERLGISDVFTFDHHFLIYRYGLHRQKAFTCLP
ncbi:MAG TPA: hypothetical protein DCK87_06050 [Desulfotomaculum sp.]|nr:hypothetical protein [Desulfotomaculum sp.]